MSEMQFHEAANIFPLDKRHLDELAADIRKNGLQVPIETLDGKILDGRRRYLACEKAKVRPQFRAMQATDPIAYVLSLNLHRRHLSPTQLAMVGARARKWYDEQAKGRQKRKPAESVPENLPEQKGDARDQAGAAVGVSGKMVDHATRILQNATPKLIAAVEEDLVAVSTAARFSTLSDPEQDAIADRAVARKEKGGPRRSRPTAVKEAPAEEANGAIKEQGKGVILAHEAINCLTRIPKNDALRKQGFRLVTDWIKRNP